jgi:hypothetical protein
MTGLAQAGTITLSGFLDDPANPALLASDGYLDLQAARFGNDNEIVRNVAVYELTVPTAATFSFTSFGAAAFGAEPYFTVFSGGDTSATFVDSNGLSDPANIDFSFTHPLTAGTYLVAIGVWFNQSFAENNPDADPSIGDGFTALGDPNLLGNYYYEVEISADVDFRTTPRGDLRNQPGTPVPEPSTIALLAAGAMLARRRIIRLTRP